MLQRPAQLRAAGPPRWQPAPTPKPAAHQADRRPPACPGLAPAPLSHPSCVVASGLAPDPLLFQSRPGAVSRSCASTPTLCPDCQLTRVLGRRAHSHQLDASPGARRPPLKPRAASALPVSRASSSEGATVPSTQVEMPPPLKRLLPSHPPSSYGLTKAYPRHP